MVQRVIVNGVIHQFPDEATPQMIAEALGVQPPDDSSTNAVSSGSDESIFSAIKNAITSNYPTSVADKRAGLAKSSGNTVIDALQGLLSGGISGLGKGGQFIAKTLTGGYAPSGDIDKLANAVGPQDDSLVGNVAKGFGQYAPYAAIGGATLPGQLAAGSLSGAATTGSDESNLFGLLPSGKTGGAIESAVLNALTHGGAKALESLRPSKVLRGTQTPEQLQQSLDVTQGTQTPLGDVIGSPGLKRFYENILTHIPFSGASQTSQDVAQGIKAQGNNIFSQIGVDQLGPNSGAQLQDALKQAAADARAEKNKSFEAVNKLADDANLTIGRENFSNKAKETLDDIDQSPELKRTFPKDLLGDIQVYADNKQGNTLKLTNIFKGKLGDQASEFYTDGKRYEYGIVKGLQDALGKDIDSSINKLGTPELKDKYAQAQKDYQEKFAPFEDPDVVKFTRLGGDSDLMLSHFLRPGQNDRANLLTKLMQKVSPESKDLPLQMYLSRSVENGEVNPLTFRSLYDKLGENQKNVLIKDDNTRNMLENYADLVRRNTTPLTIMANPKTGQQNLDALTAGVIGLLGHGVAGNTGAIAGAGGAIVGGKLANKALTSEAVRNALVKNMISGKPRFTGGAKIPTYQAAQQALVNALGGGNNQ
jgi:hypothetical protein